MVKIKDIAERAQLSNATVSRILRNDPLLSVREETRREVWRIADEMGYVRKQRKPLLQVDVGIVQWISRFEEEVDPYYYELRKAIEGQLVLNGYRVHRFYKEDAIDDIERYNLSGLICVGKFAIRQAEYFKNTVQHIVFVDSNPDSERFCSVVFDFESAVKRLLDYLKACGHRHIGLIGGHEFIGPDNEPYYDKREKTFIEIMQADSDFDYRPDDVYIHEFSAETGYQSMLEALDKGDVPTAFFCESDTIAMGALRALGERNKSVSIIGFNDIGAAQYFNPALTTIRLDMKAMSVAAVGTLKHLLTTPGAIPFKVQLSTKLIIRDSVSNLSKS